MSTTTAPAKPWNPNHLQDDALITFGPPPAGTTNPAVASFHDFGYMPITETSVNDGKVNHFFLKYDSTGVINQATGTIDYSQLHYQMFSYQGTASFGHAADGTPTMTGVHDAIQLYAGDLIPGQGHLAFGRDGSISGEINVTAKVGGSGGPVAGSFDIMVHHAASDVGYSSKGMTLTGGTSTMVFVPHT